MAASLHYLYADPAELPHNGARQISLEELARTQLPGKLLEQEGILVIGGFNAELVRRLTAAMRDFFPLHEDLAKPYLTNSKGSGYFVGGATQQRWNSEFFSLRMTGIRTDHPLKSLRSGFPDFERYLTFMYLHTRSLLGSLFSLREARLFCSHYTAAPHDRNAPDSAMHDRHLLFFAPDGAPWEYLRGNDWHTTSLQPGQALLMQRGTTYRLGRGHSRQYSVRFEL